MPDGRRVVLEGLTVNHYQMYTRLSVGLSLLPAVEMLELLPDARSCYCLMVCRSAGGQIFLPDGQIF